MTGYAISPVLCRANRYGFTWLATKPTKTRLRKLLVEEWQQGNATELGHHVPGRRDVRA